MGCWGPGNLDSDCSHGWVADLVEEIAVEVDEIMARPAIDFGTEDPMAQVHVIKLLCAESLPAVPEVERIQEWKTTYLRAIDETLVKDWKATKEHAKEKRQIASQTFDNLLKLAEKYHC